MSEIKFAPVKPFVPTPNMVNAMSVRATTIREEQADREDQLATLKANLSVIAAYRKDGLMSKAQAKRAREGAIALYVSRGGQVKVMPNGAITFA